MYVRPTPTYLSGQAAAAARAATRGAGTPRRRTHLTGGAPGVTAAVDAAQGDKGRETEGVGGADDEDAARKSCRRRRTVRLWLLVSRTRASAAACTVVTPAAMYD